MTFSCLGESQTQSLSFTKHYREQSKVGFPSNSTILTTGTNKDFYLV